jgi:hypothetical protein
MPGFSARKLVRRAHGATFGTASALFWRARPPKETAVNEQLSWDLQDDASPPGNLPEEETLVADPRGEMSPAQIVERKLVTLLRTGPLPVSMVHTERYTGR